MTRAEWKRAWSSWRKSHRTARESMLAVIRSVDAGVPVPGHIRGAVVDKVINPPVFVMAHLGEEIPMPWPTGG